jgi:hypothetical protein
MKTNKRNPERGVALLMVLLIVVLLTAIGAALIFMSNVESTVNLNYRAEQQAYYAARAGVEEVRDRMKLGNPFPGYPPNPDDPVFTNVPTIVPGAGPAGVLYVINQGTDPTPIQPWDPTPGNPYMDDEICHDYTFGGMPPPPPTGTRCTPPAVAGWFNNVASTAPFAGTSGALNYKWVRLTWKENNSVQNHQVDPAGAATTPVCYDGITEFLLAGAAACQLMNPANPPEPVYMLTALAVTNNGARRMVQSEVAKVLFPPAPAALTFAGPAAVFGAPNSNPYKVNGNDQAVPPCPPTSNKPGIGAFDAASQVAITAAIPPGRTGNYQGNPAVTPSVSNVGPTGVPTPPGNTLGPWGDVNQLNQIVQNISTQANQTVQGGTGANTLSTSTSGLPLGNMGSAANPIITVINGNVTFTGNTTGGGILLVTGNLKFSGNTTFDGIVLVIGSGSLTVSGGGGGTFNGAVLVANTQTGVVGTTPGPPTVDWSGGGGNGVYYNSCDVNSLNNKAYYHTIAWREVAY